MSNAELPNRVNGAVSTMQTMLRAMVDRIQKEPGFTDNSAMRQDVNRLYSSLDHLNRVETDKW